MLETQLPVTEAGSYHTKVGVVYLTADAIWHLESKAHRPEQPAERNLVKVTQSESRPVRRLSDPNKQGLIWPRVQAALAHTEMRFSIALSATKITHYIKRKNTTTPGEDWR